jgi:hypothetical protein
MNDRDRDRGADGPRGRGDQGQHNGGDRGGSDRGRGGPPGTEFLDLELSKVLYGRAQSMSRSVAEEIIRDAIRARIKERLGPRLEAIGRLAADELIGDIEANLEIEATIAARREARRAMEGEIGAAVRGVGVGAAPPDSDE